MAKVAFVSVLALAFAVSGGSALAAKKSFVINGIDLGTISGSETINGVLLSANAPNSVVANFSIPSDYKKNSEITLRIRALVPDTGCSVELSAEGTNRYRQGFEGLGVGGANSGLTISGGTTVAAPGVASEVFTKAFKLNKPTSGPILNQLAGDSVVAIMARQGAAMSDDCNGNMLVTSVKVTYETN
jgi:hypothetical protein